MRTLWKAFLRFFFRVLYNELAFVYDLVAWVVSFGQWREWGRTALPHVHGKRVLELGHGPGHLLVALKQEGFDPVGLDVSPSMARQARARLRSAGLSVPLVRARAQALPFRDPSFDTVIATFPTDFILDPRTLQEVSRAMRPGARLVTVLGVRFEGEGMVPAFLTWLYRITGQDDPDVGGLLECLADHGLSPHIVREQVDGTTVLLIVAERR